MSKIVETEYGFHIIQLIEKKGDQVNVRHILKKPRISDEAITEGITFLDSLSNAILKGDLTFDEAATRFSQDKDTRMNYGNMVKWLDLYHREADTRFEMRDLPTEVARAVTGLNVGEISKPFVMIGSSGKEVVAIIKLKNKIEGHKASMVDDYQVLQNIVMDKLSQDKIEKWVREKQKSTYVRINDAWKNCEFNYQVG